MNGPAWMYRRLPRVTHWWRRLARANYEHEMTLLPALCDRARTGIDVGAKVGMYSYRIRRHSSDVVVFEPIPLFNRMLAAVFDGKRGRVEPFALSDVAGTVVMRLPYDRAGEQQFGRATIEPANPLVHEAVARVDELEVETRTLDSYTWGSVGFIKIDVEGHELAVLAGAEQTLAAHRPNLLIECNQDHNAAGPVGLGAWLADHGYQVVFLDGAKLAPIAAYDFDLHWKQRGLENFIGLHRDRPEQRARLEAHLAR